MLFIWFQKQRLDVDLTQTREAQKKQNMMNFTQAHFSSQAASHSLYDDLREPGAPPGLGYIDTFTFANKLGMNMPNLAPDVDSHFAEPAAPVVKAAPVTQFAVEGVPSAPEGPKKKKYAKEAWPGRKQVAHGLFA